MNDKPYPTLADVCHGRDNNFKLIRFGASLTVFAAHAATIAGLGIIPIAALLSYVAVNAFFAISGFLVTKSLYTRNNLWHFLGSRALRMYPALIIAVIFTLLVGMYFSSLDSSSYLQHPLTQSYTFKNLLQLIWPIPITLPGLPWHQVNAPLWTLPFEIHMYLLLALAGTMALAFKGRAQKIVWSIYFLVVAISTVMYVLDYGIEMGGYGMGHYRYYLRFISLFGIGAALFLAREKVPLKTSYVVIILVLIALSSPFRLLFVFLAYGSMAYVLLYLAYVPGGFIRKFNRLGDYSYGIYIFGYPVKLTVMALLPDIHVFELFVIAFSITLIMAIVSWHYLERPALALKRKFVTAKPLSSISQPE